MVNAKTWNPAQIDQAIRRLEGIIRSGSYNPAELNQLLNQLGETGYINTWNPAELDQKLRTLLHDLLSWKTATGNPIQLRTNNGGLVQSCEVTFSPIQSGSGDPSPSNVRPISGWDSLVLNQSGKNLFDKNAITDSSWLSTTTGEIETSSSTTNYVVSDFIPVLANKPVYIPASGSARRWFYDSNKNPVTYLNNSGNQSYTPTNSGYIRITINKTQISLDTYQVEQGSTATTYEPYNGQTHTATFSDTIMGGTYDFVSGKGDTVYSEKIKISDLAWTYLSSGSVFRSNVPNKANGKTNFYSECFNVVTTDVSSMNNNEITGATDSNRVYVKSTDYTTIEDFLTAYGDYNICVELATPTEITLTPEEIELLSGENVLWTDGDSIEITYKKLLLPSDVEELSKSKKIEEKPKTTKRSKKKKEE